VGVEGGLAIGQALTQHLKLTGDRLQPLDIQFNLGPGRKAARLQPGAGDGDIAVVDGLGLAADVGLALLLDELLRGNRELVMRDQITGVIERAADLDADIIAFDDAA
jgi:hypothetical protein